MNLAKFKFFPDYGPNMVEVDLDEIIYCLPRGCSIMGTKYWLIDCWFRDAKQHPISICFLNETLAGMEFERFAKKAQDYNRFVEERNEAEGNNKVN